MIEVLTDRLNAFFANRDTTVARDLKLNMARVLKDSSLKIDETGPLLVALARATDFGALEACVRAEGSKSI